MAFVVSTYLWRYTKLIPFVITFLRWIDNILIFWCCFCLFVFRDFDHLYIAMFWFNVTYSENIAMLHFKKLKPFYFVWLRLLEVQLCRKFLYLPSGFRYVKNCDCWSWTIDRNRFNHISSNNFFCEECSGRPSFDCTVLFSFLLKQVSDFKINYSKLV